MKENMVENVGEGVCVEGVEVCGRGKRWEFGRSGKGVWE